MNTVRQLLQDKGYEVSSIEPDNSVYNAMQVMAARNISALLVLEDRKLIGIISERDFFHHIRLLDKPLRNVQVEEIMTSKVAYVGPDNTTEDCMKVGYQDADTPFAGDGKRSVNQHYLYW